MEGKILGIPLILILLVLFIALLVDIPVVLLNITTQKRLSRIENNQVNTMYYVREVEKQVQPTPVVTATPSAALLPTKPAFRTVTRPAQ